MTSQTLQIRTPDGIEFSLPIASPVLRSLAWILDALAIAATATLCASAIAALAAVTPFLAQALGVLIFFAVQTGYGMAFEWYWRGQTPGKRALGLRVMDAQGLRLQPSQVVLRNLLRPVDSLPIAYLVGGVAAVLSRHGQRLGDLAAGTVVVRTRRAQTPDTRASALAGFNSLRAHPHLAARLRQRVAPAQAAAALEAVLRRDTLDPEARLGLFATMAAHFRAVVAFPTESIEGLTDEAYVRAVVEILFDPPQARAASGKPEETPSTTS